MPSECRCIRLRKKGCSTRETVARSVRRPLLASMNAQRSPPPANSCRRRHHQQPAHTPGELGGAAAAWHEPVPRTHLHKHDAAGLLERGMQGDDVLVVEPNVQAHLRASRKMGCSARRRRPARQAGDAGALSLRQRQCSRAQAAARCNTHDGRPLLTSRATWWLLTSFSLCMR